MKIELDIPVEEFNYTEYDDDYDYCTGEKNNHINVLIEMITDKAVKPIINIFLSNWCFIFIHNTFRFTPYSFYYIIKYSV